MTKSGYENLLARYSQIAISKTGTAYEVLAAMVCKALEEQNAVIHDIKLRGRTGVKHQIDICVETKTGKRTLLVECKDFSVGKRKVGLGVIRNFESVVADIRPDEAWVVICVGFTRDARKFAKATGIKPIIMRTFEDKDEIGRIKNIILNIHVPTVHSVRASIYASDADMPALQAAMQTAGVTSGIEPNHDVVFESSHGTRIHFVDFVDKESLKIKPEPKETTGRYAIKADDYKLLIAGSEVSYDGVLIEYGVGWETDTRHIVADRIAELILQGVGDADIIIIDDQLRRRQIDPEIGRID
jgi:hypothetical protein